MVASNAVFIASESYRGHSYGQNHPLKIPRVPLTLDLLDAYGALGPKAYLEARPASLEELGWFHGDAYIAALRRCEERGRVDGESGRRFNLGNFENPYFDKFFTIPSLAAGGSIQGAEQVLEGRVAFNPAGGMHHAMPHKARGFCYINDAVLGILRLRRAGWRVLYFDMDAHHGDGVQFGLDGDPQALTVSFHMDTAYAYPRKGGGTDDIGSSRSAVNLPFPQGVNDSEYRFAFDALWPEILDRFKPDAIVLQTGTDILREDPLGKFFLSNRLFLDIVASIKERCPRNEAGTPRLLVIGGGGYHPLVLARCWAGVWGVLAGRQLPDTIPELGRRLLEQVRLQTDEDSEREVKIGRCLIDPPRKGPVRAKIRQRVDQLLQGHPIFKSTFSGR